MSVYKFGALDGVAHIWPDVWSVEKTTGPKRLVAAPSSGHVDLLIELSRVLPEPFGILYVLMTPRMGHQCGRYQCPEPIDRATVGSFLHQFEEYFENDGRHHVWLTSLPREDTIVYDNHNVIYAYGPLRKYRKIIKARGLKKGSTRFPVPHVHCYNDCYDADEDRVMSYWEWRWSALADDE